MIFIDTHTHLYLSEFDADREAMLERARAAGVAACVLPNIDEESLAPMTDMADRWPELCYPMAGLHPTSVTDEWRTQLSATESLRDSGTVAGIGECGIDLYWDQSRLEAQKEAFALQLQWSLDSGLPVSIHIRNAFPEVFSVLDLFGDARFNGVFHCFSGGKEEAERAIARGFMLGIGGVITFKKNRLRDVIREVSPESVVLETDAPFLAPDPFRGKRNEPAYLPYVAEALADIWGMPLQSVAGITSDNACKVFTKLS